MWVNQICACIFFYRLLKKFLDRGNCGLSDKVFLITAYSVAKESLFIVRPDLLLLPFGKIFILSDQCSALIV